MKKKIIALTVLTLGISSLVVMCAGRNLQSSNACFKGESQSTEEEKAKLFYDSFRHGGSRYNPNYYMTAIRGM